MLKEFWIKISLLIGVPVLVLSFLGFAVDTGLKKSHHPNYAEWNDLFQGKINADVLVSGSSRAAFHISPFILDTTLQVNSYNLGLSAWRFDMQLTRFKLYLAHNRKPQYIIHNVDVYGFAKRKNLVDYQQFLPYLNEPLLKRNFERLQGNFTWSQCYIPMYKYANDWDLVWEGLKNFVDYPHVTKTSKYKGYQANDIAWDNQFELFKKKYPKGIRYTIEKDVEQSFERYLDFCQKEGIKVVLVYAPEYFEVQPYYKNKTAFLRLCHRVEKQYNCTFLDYTNDSICFEKSLFYNSQHLNKKGAELFSAKLAKDLQKIW
jgi:hypothetical protein